MIYDQGDIVMVDFSPSIGHEPAKRRPALVVSTIELNLPSSMTMVCPITSTDNGFPLHLKLPEDCCVAGFVITEQLRALDLDARSTEHIGKLDNDDLDKIIECIRSFF